MVHHAGCATPLGHEALFPRRRKLVTMSGWVNSGDSRMSTSFPASPHWPKSGAFSATPGPWSSRSVAAEKNALRGLRASLSHLLRSTPTPRPRYLLWRQAGLPRPVGAPGQLPPVWRCETRALGLVGRQPPVHQAVRLLRRQAVPGEHRPGGCRGTAPGLAHRQGPGQAVHAGAPPSGGLPRATGHRHRRDRRRQTPPLPHRGQRPGAGTPDLVRWQGPLRGEPRRVLRLARPREMPQDPRGRHGHVEGLPQVDPQRGSRPAGPDHLRQVPCPESPEQGHGRGAATRVRAALGQGPSLHQGGNGTTSCLAGRTSVPKGVRR